MQIHMMHTGTEAAKVAIDSHVVTGLTGSAPKQSLPAKHSCILHVHVMYLIYVRISLYVTYDWIVMYRGYTNSYAKADMLKLRPEPASVSKLAVAAAPGLAGAATDRIGAPK